MVRVSILQVSAVALASLLMACGDLDPLAPTVAKLSINPPSASISTCDGNQSFVASAFGPDGAPVDTRIAKVLWSVSDPSKASISDTGVLTPKEAGGVQVIAKIQNQATSTKVDVTISRDTAVAAYKIVAGQAVLDVGGSTNLRIDAVNRCNQSVGNPSEVFSFSSDAADGTVSGNNFTAKRGGSLNISAVSTTDAKKVASGFVNVRFKAGLATSERQTKRFFDRVVKVSGVDQTERTNFFEYLPNDFGVDASKKHPLLIFFPGAGTPSPESSSDVSPTEVLANNTGDPSLAGMVVLTPFFPVGSTEAPWQPDRVQAIINQAKSRYPVDEKRIYLTGFSFGGGAVWNFVGSSKQNADQIAAVAVVAGSLRFYTKQYLLDPGAFAGEVLPVTAYDFQGLGCNIEASNLPVRATHSPSDTVVSPTLTQTVIESLECLSTAAKISPRPQYLTTDLNGLNHDATSAKSWDPTFRPTQGEGKNVYEWLLQYKR